MIEAPRERSRSSGLIRWSDHPETASVSAFEGYFPSMKPSLLGLVLLVAAPEARAQECPPAPTALVLSGGGAKGLAHIGVLRTLDSLGARPDLIVGTSMGAIVGALYASGYSARQIDSLARALPISEIVRPFRTMAPHPWDQRIPLLFLVRGTRGFEFQTGIVDETQPNARLNSAMLRGNLLARGRFDRLPIPFRAVATDLRDRSTVVLAEGDLARAVRASSAIPLVFPPVAVESAVLVDGGLSANIPIEEARAAGARRVIVSDVTEKPKATLDVESPLALADQLIGFLFQQRPANLGSEDLYLRPDVQTFRSLDFSPSAIEDLLGRGRRAADSVLGRAACLPRRPAVDPPPIPGILRDWRVVGGSTADSVLVARMLGLKGGDSLDPSRLRVRLLGLAQAEALRGVWLNPTGSADSVGFRIEPIRAPRAVGGAGASYDHELGGQAWAGIFDRQMLGTTLEGSLLASVGRLRREVAATALWHFDAGWSRLTPTVRARIGGEDIRRFDPDGEELPTLGTTETSLVAGTELWPGRAWRILVSGDLLAWKSDSLVTETTAGVSARVSRNTGTGPQVVAAVTMTDAFRSARLVSSWQLSRGRWRLLPTVRLGWGHDLPVQRTFSLGDDDGFPGLHLGERRGAREASGSVRVGFSLEGPIEARLLLAAGDAWSAGAEPRWLAGGRLGVGADTPVGPLEAGYGVATNGRGALFIRLGKRF
jgi:NTE family protein